MYMEEIQEYGPADTWDPPPSSHTLSTIQFGASAPMKHQNCLASKQTSASGELTQVGPWGAG